MRTATDYRALTEPVDPTALRVFAQKAKADGTMPTSTNWLLQVVCGLALAVILGGAVYALVSEVVRKWGENAGSNVTGIIFSTVLTIVVLLDLMYVWTAIALYRNRYRILYRMDAFAAANGLSYVARQDAPPFSGDLFARGYDPFRANVFAGAEPLPFELGDFRYTESTGTGRDRRKVVRSQAYLEVKLTVTFPRTVLVAKKPTQALDPESTNGLSEVSPPAGLDDRWRLYSDASADQLAKLFAPALVALLSGRTGKTPKGENALDTVTTEVDYELQLIGDRCYVYGARTFQWVGHETFRRMLGIVDELTTLTAV